MKKKANGLTPLLLVNQLSRTSGNGCKSSSNSGISATKSQSVK